jgi:hypothetical protein
MAELSGVMAGSSMSCLDHVMDRHMSVTEDPYNAVKMVAEVRAQNAVDAADLTSQAVDEALLRVGLFEQFDVSGKSLAIRPWDRTESDGPPAD